MWVHVKEKQDAETQEKAETLGTSEAGTAQES
jgi:hypothetical protein